MSYENCERIISQCSREITGPVIFNFVRWVLDEAVRKNIKTLYFLARDGCTPYRIAEMLVEYFGLPISCKYLYCSRCSLRIPTYHLIGEEAYELLSLGGYHITMDLLLDRGAISEESKEKILQELKVTDAERRKILLKRELDEFTQRLCKNATYRAAIEDVSKKAYPATIGYLKQEGLFEQNVVAVVDSGWTGSMQRSLRQLLQSAGFTGTVVGFYFGMYAKPKDKADGEYFTYYFNELGAVKDKIFFCNNLFECILSAPHGMTKEYREKDGRFEPVFGELLPGGTENLSAKQQEEILAYVAEHLSHHIKVFNKDEVLKNDRVRLHRFMSKPTIEEAIAYGSFQFDDDITGKNETALACKAQTTLLRGYSIPARVLRKLRKRGGNMPELFWAYGTIAFLAPWKRLWYWWNVTIWEWLKYII